MSIVTHKDALNLLLSKKKGERTNQEIMDNDGFNAFRFELGNGYHAIVQAKPVFPSGVVLRFDIEFKIRSLIVVKNG